MVSAVIFDCDGVLVDSEVLIHTIELEILADLGMHYESGPFKARFMGMSDNAYYEALDLDALERLGRKIQSEARPLMKARIEKVFDEQLAEVKGAGRAVKAVRLRKAVASSSGVKALDYKLKKLDLWDLFVPHIYSGEHVAHAKPAPDLFLYAAKKLDVPPAECLVIEDSVNGVRAGIAAGMAVWGFSGGGHMDDHMSERLREAGAVRVVKDWDEAVALFAGL
jgi:beta-phosphoglucomutase-like phosphatase (HAD superfamily)